MRSLPGGSPEKRAMKVAEKKEFKKSEMNGKKKQTKKEKSKKTFLVLIIIIYLSFRVFRVKITQNSRRNSCRDTFSGCFFPRHDGGGGSGATCD